MNMAAHIPARQVDALALEDISRMLSAIPSLPRPVLARLTDEMIQRLDEIDGDSDLELNGDELDGTGGEDDFIERYGANMGGGWSGPGCPISDPDVSVDDQGEAVDEGEPDEIDYAAEERDMINPEQKRAHVRYIRSSRFRRAESRYALRPYPLLDR